MTGGVSLFVDDLWAPMSAKSPREASTINVCHEVGLTLN